MLTKVKAGDTVVIIATARWVTTQDISAFLSWAASHALNVELSPNLFEVHHQFAGSDQQRADDLLWALTHPTATAVFCARGGYGTLRTLKQMLEQLTFDEKNIDGLMRSQWKKKLFIGFSDVTVLHSWLNSYGWISLHGPVVNQWNNEGFSDTLFSLEKAIFTGRSQLDVSHLPQINAKPFEAELVGGNLSLVYSLLATPFRINWQNRVLLLEDLDEYLYHIDRMMQTLESSGLFASAQAIIVGGMTEMRDNTVPFGDNAVDIIRKIASKYSIPVIFNVPIGHLSTNYSVFLGTSITFDGRFLSQNS